MAEKKPFTKITSPAGRLASFPCLLKEDDKYGGFKCGIILEDNEETRAYVGKLEAIRDEHWKSLGAAVIKKKKLVKADVYEEELDDAGEETGNLIVRFKSKHAPDMFDAGKPPQIIEGVDPWRGSIIKVAGAFAGYDMPATKLVGCTKYMNALQIIELVSSRRDASSYGFDGEDGGFEAPHSDGAAAFDADEEVDEDDDF